QCRGEAADTAADDNRFHGPNSVTLRQLRSGSHGRSLRRKRLCRLSLQLGPGLRLSLNPKLLEILPIADAVAEDLLLAGQILRRAEHALRAVPGGSLYREGGIDQMWPAERHKISAAGSQNGVDLVSGRDVADAHGRHPRFVTDLIGEWRL